MDSSNNIYGVYGENFLEDFMSSSSDGNSADPSKTSSTFSGGDDILQQSLRAADILDNNAGDAPFDDLGFMMNNDSYSNNSASSFNQFEVHSPASSTNLYFSSSPAPQSDVTGSSFNADDFLNIPSKTPSLPSKSNLVQSISSDVDFFSSPPQVVSSVRLPANAIATNTVDLTNPTEFQFPQQRSTIQIATKPNVLVSSSPKTLAQVQIPANKSSAFARQGQTNNLIHSHQNMQYAVTGTQSLTQYNNTSYAVCTGTTLQSNSVTVCGTTFTRPIRQSVPAPVIIQTNVCGRSQAQTGFALNSEAPKQYLTTVTNTPQSTVLSAANREEQTNKIALILRTKAAQQSGTGNARILRVGDQNINISDPAVVKALAAKIYEQRLKQQGQSQVSNAVSTTQQMNSINQALNQTVANISATQGKLVASASQLQQKSHVQQTQYVYSVPQNNSNAQGNFIQIGKTKAPSTFSATANGPVSSISPQVQLTAVKPNSSLSLNRIQIASVNVPLSSNQASVHNGQTQRSTIPVQIISKPISQGATNRVGMQVLRPGTVAASSSGIVQHLGNTLKFNVTPQQASSMTKEQLQKLQIQHQASIRARQSPSPVLISQAKAPISPVTTSTVLHQVKTSQNLVNSRAKTPATKVVLFRVDPNLTSQQVEQVQQIISKKAMPPNSAPLTLEQKQLLAAFRAYLRTLEHPIQQYYLRNPQLFLQKVFAQIQTGQPYVFQAKLEQANNIKSSTAVTTPSRQHHPTISLGQGAVQPQGKVQMIKVNRVPSPTLLSQRKVAKRPAVSSSPKPLTMQASPPKRPSLIMEQLEDQRKKVSAPDINTPFISVRDAFHKLLPYHVYNTPEVKESAFDESEPLFDKLSDELLLKQTNMLTKYHMLCLRESTKEICSAELVMLERTYLQHERSMFAQLKKEIKDSPNAIEKYVTPSHVESHPDLVQYLEEQSNLKMKFESPVKSTSDMRKISYQSADSTDFSSPCSSITGRSNNQSMQDFESVACEEVPMETHSEILLQEAVDSILS